MPNGFTLPVVFSCEKYFRCVHEMPECITEGEVQGWKNKYLKLWTEISIKTLGVLK